MSMKSAVTTRKPVVTAEQTARIAAVGVVIAIIGVTVALVAAAGSGAVAATVIADPGSLVRWGLVGVRVVSWVSRSKQATPPACCTEVA